MTLEGPARYWQHGGFSQRQSEQGMETKLARASKEAKEDTWDGLHLANNFVGTWDTSF
jgi:hypothetical protein